MIFFWSFSLTMIFTHMMSVCKHLTTTVCTNEQRTRGELFFLWTHNTLKSLNLKSFLTYDPREHLSFPKHNFKSIGIHTLLISQSIMKNRVMILYFQANWIYIVHLKFLKFQKRHEEHHRTVFNLSESSNSAERSDIAFSTRKVIHQIPS